VNLATISRALCDSCAYDIGLVWVVAGLAI